MAQISEADILKIKNSFKRCSAETTEAILRFREAQDPACIQPIIYGIIERYMSSQPDKRLADMPEDTKLIEDLGIDSLTMLEVVLSIEEALLIRIENEELMQIRTLHDVKSFLEKKIASGEITGASGANHKARFTRDEIILILPQQPPFLFLDSAEVDGDIIHAQYKITGEEHFLEGHFKDEPVFPAAIIFEAMGQAACLWILSQAEFKLGKKLDSKHVLFGSMESAHVYRKARPGDTLKFEINVQKLREPLAVFQCKGTLNGEKLALVEELVIIFGDATQLESTHTDAEPAEALPKL
jgi:3-hydroxyacyl-[acyl-carrier-protein] dehydratase